MRWHYSSGIAYALKSLPSEVPHPVTCFLPLLPNSWSFHWLRNKLLIHELMQDKLNIFKLYIAHKHWNILDIIVVYRLEKGRPWKYFYPIISNVHDIKWLVDADIDHLAEVVFISFLPGKFNFFPLLPLLTRKKTLCPVHILEIEIICSISTEIIAVSSLQRFFFPLDSY